MWAGTLVLGVLLLVGCDSGGEGPVDPPDAPPVPTTVTLTPGSHAFTALLETLGMEAEVTDQYGAAMPNATVIWRSEDTDIATVESTGTRTALVAARATGETSVVATAGSATAAAAVAVEQVPASVESVAGNALGDFPPLTAVEVVARVQDRNGEPIRGIEVVFGVEEGDGTVAPESSTADAEGLATTTWTLGTSGIQTLSATAGPVSVRLSADLCDPIVLDPGLELGEPQVLPRSEIGCGLSVEAAEAGAYYRFTLVGTSHFDGPVQRVELSVVSMGAAAGPRRVVESPGRVSSVAAPAEPHPGRRERDGRVLSWIARLDGPRALPDLRGRLRRSRTDPPEKRVFTRGSAGTIEDNCTVDQRITGVRLAFNDHIAIYAGETLSPLLPADDAAVIADHYRDFGEPVIREYFGGVGDVDGDGRIIVLFEDFDGRAAAFVWMGELLSKDDCPASNQAELMRVNASWMKPEHVYALTGLVVHEAKHISSHHQLVRRAEERGAGHFDVMHPRWVEEGTAEIAREVSARLGWESIGGPPPGATVRGSDLRRPNGTSRDLFTPAANGVRAVLERYGRVISDQPNSINGHDVYGGGWGFFRFVGDWFGGAGASRLGDAALFARLNDASAPVGLDGIREVVGRRFEELMIDYAQAVSLAGTGSPVVSGVPRFTTYDMTGMNRTPFSTVLANGVYPYPVTREGERLWRPLGEPIAIVGEMGANGFRIHDFRAERAGDRATIRVDAPEHVRLVVVRIPDQMGRSGSG